MNRNLGTADRVTRVVLAVGAVAWAAALGWSSTGAIVLLVLAAVLGATAAIAFCPLYRLIGLSTRRPADTIATPSARAEHRGHARH